LNLTITAGGTVDYSANIAASAKSWDRKANQSAAWAQAKPYFQTASCQQNGKRKTRANAVSAFTLVFLLVLIEFNERRTETFRGSGSS